MLIPLLGRARETQRGRGLIDDPRAVEIVEQLDYDFSKWEGARSLIGSALRTRMFDDDVSAFLSANPDGTVVEIGCGLNTRFERLDNGLSRWIELDLPDVIGLRREFFEDNDRRTTLEANVLDDGWLDKTATDGPVCFVSEAALIYLEETDAERVLKGIAKRFPDAWIVMDTTSKAIVDGQSRHDVMKHLPRDSWFRWRCDSPETIERLGLRLVRSRSLFDAHPGLLRRAPLRMRLMIKLARLLLREARGYRINRYVVDEQPRPTSGRGRC